MAQELIVESSEKEGTTTVLNKENTSVPNNDGVTKNRRFTDYLIERNGVSQLMVDGVFGVAPLWKGRAAGRVVGWYNDPEKLDSVIKELKKQDIDYTNVFISFNKPKEEAYVGKKFNQLFLPNIIKGGVFKDSDISYRSNLFIDVDPVIKDRPVSEEVSGQSLTVCKLIRKDLIELGFPDPIATRTGNGAALFFPLRGVKNNDKSKYILKKLYKYLAKYSTAEAKVDMVVGNASRYGRCPGTTNFKESGEGGDKFRNCKVVYFPEKLEQLRAKKLEQIVSNLPETTEEKIENDNKPNQIKETYRKRQINVPSYLSHYHIKMHKEKIHDGDTLFCLEKCVFDPSHSPNKASIRQDVNGKLYYQCFHDSCAEKTWHDARAKISKDDKLTDFIEGARLPAQGVGKNYDDVRVFGMAEIMACERTCQTFMTDILSEGEACLLVGPSGVGKSAFTLGMSLAGAAPRKTTLGLSAFEVRKPFTTLFVQSENNMVHTSNRIKIIIKHNKELGNGKNGIFILGQGDDCMLTGELSDLKFQSLLINHLIEYNINVLVIDPLISFHNKNENDNAEMRKELDCLKNVCQIAGVSVILVHHAAKGHTAENKGGRGASAIADWADRIIFIDRESKDNKDLLRLTCQKSRNSSMFKPFYIDITDMKFERVSGVGNEKTDVALKALDELGGSADTQEKLANKIVADSGVSMSTAKRYIKQAVDAGLIEETGKGKSVGYKSLEVVDD